MRRRSRLAVRWLLAEHSLTGGEPASQLLGAPRLFAGYGVFLMVLVIVVAQIAGRML
ncbi:MAG: hypothetical protein ACXWR1_19780 [Bdellovibrionota bacterium]